MIVGITGGSGTGKSTACRFFRENGWFIIDADSVAREVCSKGTKCLSEIKAQFGAGVIDTDGNLKRKELGEIVFSDKSRLDKLNSITHKYIVEEIKNRAKNNDGNIVIDAPLLLETGLDSLCDKTLCVLADEDIRIKRICKRDMISAETAKNRIASQKEDSYYRERCDFAVMNNGTEEELIMETAKIFGGNDGR